MIALISPDDEITILASGPGVWRLEVPDTSITVSPVESGWSHGGWRILDVIPFQAPDGKIRIGAPSYTIDGDAVVETYDYDDPPAPTERLEPHYGYVRFGYVAGDGIVVREMSHNVGGVTRVATGRYRIRDGAENGVELVGRAVTPRDSSTTPIHTHVSAVTPEFVEVRCFRWNGSSFVATDPAEIVVEFDKVVMQ